MTLTSLLYGWNNRAKIYLYGKSKILYGSSMGIVKNPYDFDFTPLWVETRNLYLVRIESAPSNISLYRLDIGFRHFSI